jgi:hypothetical protein
MLTDTNIRKAKPRVKALKLFDGGGLYLEVNPAGEKSGAGSTATAARRSGSPSGSIPT